MFVCAVPCVPALLRVPGRLYACVLACCVAVPPRSPAGSAPVAPWLPGPGAAVPSPLAGCWVRQLPTASRRAKLFPWSRALDVHPEGGLQLGDGRKGTQESNTPMDGPRGDATSSVLDCVSQGTAGRVSLGVALRWALVRPEPLGVPQPSVGSGWARRAAVQGEAKNWSSLQDAKWG